MFIWHSIYDTIGDVDGGRERAIKQNRLLGIISNNFLSQHVKSGCNKVETEEKQIKIGGKKREKNRTHHFGFGCSFGTISIHTHHIFACCIAFLSLTKHIHKKIFPFSRYAAQRGSGNFVGKGKNSMYRDTIQISMQWLAPLLFWSSQLKRCRLSG